MKVKNPSTGNFEEVYVKALDSLPVGAEIDFTGSASDIPVGWEQVDDYSTTEVNTGKTWIDGKPIYRKVITFERNNHDTFSFSTPANYQKIIFMDAYCQDGDNNRFGLYYKDATDCFRFYINPSNAVVVIVGSTYPIVNFSGYFIIEYTKTTD